MNLGITATECPRRSRAGLGGKLRGWVEAPGNRSERLPRKENWSVDRMSCFFLRTLRRLPAVTIILALAMFGWTSAASATIKCTTYHDKVCSRYACCSQDCTYCVDSNTGEIV